MASKVPNSKKKSSLWNSTTYRERTQDQVKSQLDVQAEMLQDQLRSQHEKLRKKSRTCIEQKYDDIKADIYTTLEDRKRMAEHGEYLEYLEQLVRGQGEKIGTLEKKLLNTQHTC